MEDVLIDDFTIDSVTGNDKKKVLELMMDSYGDEILQLAYTYVRNRTVAEDLTQEIFIKTFKALHTYKRQSKIRTWLWRIAINHCKDHLKSWYVQKVQPKSNEEITKGQSEATVEETVMRHDVSDSLIEAVFALPTNYKEVIYLFYFEERPIKEIAHLLELKEGTVKTRMRRGKELLKELLKEEIQNG